jgi:hypothetical protein
MPRTRRLAVAMALAAGLAGFGIGRSDLTRPTLSLEGHFGDGPFTATITGPPSLLRRVEAWRKIRGGNCSTTDIRGMRGFAISWGDDKDGTLVSPLPAPNGPDGCPDLLRHTYATPGAYTVTATLFHIGPTDGTIQDWRGETWVSIDGPQRPTTLEILSPSGGGIVTVPQAIHVRYEIAAGTPVDLVVELIGADSVPLATRVLDDVAYNGSGGLELWLPGGHRSGIGEHVRTTAKIRVQAVDANQRVLVWRDSEEFTLSAE